MSLHQLTTYDISVIVPQIVFHNLVKNYRTGQRLYPSFSAVSATKLAACEDTSFFNGDFFHISVDYRWFPLALVINLNCFHVNLVFYGGRFFVVLPPWLILMRNRSRLPRPLLPVRTRGSG